MRELDILYIAYQFPPESGPAVHRNFHFANELCKRGHRVTVVTRFLSEVKGGGNVDESYKASFHPNLKVVRTSTREPKAIKSLLMKLRLYRIVWWFCYPLLWENAARWFSGAQRELDELVEKQKFDVVYTSSGPFSTMRLGRYMQRKHKLKWIADLRDPLTDAYMWNYPSKWHWHVVRYFEGKRFSQPNRLLVTTPAYRSLLIKRLGLNENKVEVLTNGY